MASATPLFSKVRARRSSEQIAIRMREMFLSGSLRAGDRLPGDEELSDLLGVRKGAVRHALRALEVAGMIELRAGRNGGAYVAKGKPKVLSDNMMVLMHLQDVTIRQLTEARVLIEEVVVRMACARASKADLDALDANVDLARVLFEQGRMLEKSIANIEFHNILAQATQNPFLVIVMSTLTEAMAAFVRETAADGGAATFASRRKFMSAMRERDADLAVAEMNKNLRRVNKIYEVLAAQREASAAQLERPAPAPARPNPPSQPKFSQVGRARAPASAPAARPGRRGSGS